MKGLVRDPARPSGVAVADLPDPGRPGPGEVRVRMRLAPVNPADRLAIAGRYAPRGGLGDILGAEGLGAVDAIGDGVMDVALGQRVILLSRGNWVEWRRVPAAEVLAVPDMLPETQAAMLRINPATAMRLLDRLALSRGDWLIQNAATSSVAGWVRRLAVGRGLRTIDVVRSNSPDAGSGGMLADGDDLAERVAEVTEGQEVAGALDAVAGTATGRLADCLAANGTLVVYGHLSGAPCVISSALLTTKSLTLHGFTLRAAEAGEAPKYLAARYAELAALAAADPEPVAGIFALGDIDAALAATGRGRILLRP